MDEVKKKPFSLAIVDDEKKIREYLGERCKAEFSSDTTIFADASTFLKAHEENAFDILVTDIRMDGMTGVELLKTVKEKSSSIQVVLITAFDDSEMANDALMLGAYDYIVKPFKVEKLLNTLHKIAEQNLLSEKTKRLSDESPHYLWSSEEEELKTKVEKAAGTESHILLTGQSGTGKSLLAKYIHENSRRIHSPFITLNCSLINENLFESELFGHEKGAFTGANDSKEGWVEKAAGGTLFLDEIGDINASAQLKLLKLIQEKTFERVGGRSTLEADIRIVFATNKDLKKEVEEGRFREDLYFRINVLHFNLLPLKDKISSLEIHFSSILNRITKRLGLPPEELPSKKVFDLLKLYQWPGNFRELENTLERALVLKENSTLSVEDFPELSEGNTVEGEKLDDVDEIPLEDKGLFDAIFDYMEQNDLKWDVLERDFYNFVWEKCKKNSTVSSEKLGVTRRVFSYKIKKGE